MLFNRKHNTFDVLFFAVVELIKERDKQLKKAGIGGRWELTDQLGNIRTTDDFKGKWCIIYFGFTHCPDICPDEMEKMVAVVSGLGAHETGTGYCLHRFHLTFISFHSTGEDSVDVQPIFITVDPARDSKEVIGKYVKEFSDKIVGLTGTVEEITKVCQAFRVYFKAGPKDKDDDYIVSNMSFPLFRFRLFRLLRICSAVLRHK